MKIFSRNTRRRKLVYRKCHPGTAPRPMSCDGCTVSLSFGSKASHRGAVDTHKSAVFFPQLLSWSRTALQHCWNQRAHNTLPALLNHQFVWGMNSASSSSCKALGSFFPLLSLFAMLSRSPAPCLPPHSLPEALACF